MRAALLRILLCLTCAGGAACASTGAVPRPFPTPDAHRRPAPPEVVPSADAPAGSVIATALGLRGVPYRNGGADPSGFDCSGFVWYVFARHGLIVPRTVAGQFQAGRPVRSEEARPGD